MNPLRMRVSEGGRSVTQTLSVVIISGQKYVFLELQFIRFLLC